MRREWRIEPTYCELCKRKEIELYGVVLNMVCEGHSEACKQAACSHNPSSLKIWNGTEFVLETH